ncbi:MAG: hypothetical protein KAW52_01970 [candidate division Zixibacteria bacterium]|nr:hypothetical protein [candidate division Zixibacteria bacterium]
MDEKRFRQILLKCLKSIDKGYKIGQEIPVPYKHIYLRENKRTKLEIWCFKQDIAIYKILFDNTVSKKVAEIIPSDKSKIQIELERGKAKKEKNIGLPYVIIETKKKQPITHEILAYSEKAKMIKTIFPYCKFVFCIYGEIEPRTYRHGIGFDRIVSIKNTQKNSQDMRDFTKQITGLIREAKKDLKKISKSGERSKG